MVGRGAGERGSRGDDNHPCSPAPLRATRTFIITTSLNQQKTARPKAQSGGCRFAEVVFASSNDSDQTGCLGGGGEATVVKQDAEHRAYYSRERGGRQRHGFSKVQENQRDAEHREL